LFGVCAPFFTLLPAVIWATRYEALTGCAFLGMWVLHIRWMHLFHCYLPLETPKFPACWTTGDVCAAWWLCPRGAGLTLFEVRAWGQWLFLLVGWGFLFWWFPPTFVAVAVSCALVPRMLRVGVALRLCRETSHESAGDYFGHFDALVTQRRKRRLSLSTSGELIRRLPKAVVKLCVDYLEDEADTTTWVRTSDVGF
jgi:hypothetical protein